MPHQGSLQVGFAPWMVAGVQVQWENMRPHVLDQADIQAHLVELHPYREGGAIERLPAIPPSVKGNLRSMVSASGLFRTPPLDALWIHNLRTALPYLLLRALPRHLKIICALDSTAAQMAKEWGGHYAVAQGGPRAAVRDALDAFCLRRVTVLAPWSDWAARFMHRQYGVPLDRIRVMPPGIDLRRWGPITRQARSDGKTKVLFVGGDFARKGGDLLLDVFRQQFADTCQLHLVTRSQIEPSPGVAVYRDLGPNDPRMIALYRRCDVFVLPTLADCFSLASLEAMASGLPVVSTRVGGIPEIVADGHSGFLITPGDGRALAERIAALVADASLRTAMGIAGRRIVETRFDAARNTAAVLDLIRSLCGRSVLVGEAGTSWPAVPRT